MVQLDIIIIFILPHPLPSLFFPATLLLMLKTVAATFLGCTADDPNREEKIKNMNLYGGVVYLSAEGPVFKTACKTDMKHDIRFG